MPSLALDGVQILVVDDNPDTLDLLATLLARHGARVEVASSVSTALQSLKEQCPDVVVSDLNMPELDGFALLRALREQHLLLPVLAFTAQSDRGHEERARQAGFQGFLTKPLDASLLVNTIATLAHAPSLLPGRG